MSGWQHSPRQKDPLPPVMRRLAWDRDHGMCVLCDAPGRDVDHIDRLAGHDLDNLRVLCGSCHTTKTQSEARESAAARRARQHRPARLTPLQAWQSQHQANHSG